MPSFFNPRSVSRRTCNANPLENMKIRRCRLIDRSLGISRLRNCVVKNNYCVGQIKNEYLSIGAFFIAHEILGCFS